MKAHRVMRQMKFLQKKCPFCYEDLGRIELLRRKVNKICRCKKCGKIIDERYIIR